MILSVRGERIIFECDGGCGRTISTEQGYMDAARLFNDEGWTAVQIKKTPATFTHTYDRCSARAM